MEKLSSEIMNNYKTNGITKESTLKLMTKLNKENTGDESKKKNAISLVRNSSEKSGKLFVEIPLDDLKVDHSYQREYDSHHGVKDLVENWNYMAYDPMKVNYRGDGFFWVMDGQHRTEAAKKLNKEYLLCEIIVGLDVKDEAMVFGNQGSCVKRPSIYNIYKANVCAGEIVDCKIKELCDEHHLIVDGSKSASHFSCLKLARAMVNKGFTDDLSWILHVLDDVGYNTYTNGHSYGTVRSLWEILKCYKDEKDILDDKIKKLLLCFSPDDLFCIARKIHPEEKHPALQAEALFKGYMADNYDIPFMQKEFAKVKENIKKKNEEKSLEKVHNKKQRANSKIAVLS